MSMQAGDPGQNNNKRNWKQTIKVPLLFSLTLGLIAGVVSMVASTGGSEHPLRIDIGLTMFGIAFIGSLLLLSLLIMASKENPEDLGKGSGINRVSARPTKRRQQGH